MRRFHYAAILALAGCAPALPAPQAGPDPADAGIRVPDAVYQPVTSGASDYRPVEPRSWRDMNEHVAPAMRRDP